MSEAKAEKPGKTIILNPQAENGGQAPAADPEAARTHRDLMQAYRLRQTRIPARFLAKSFDNFQTERRKKPREVLQAARAFVDGFNFRTESPRGLLLRGGVGTGKTHIAVAILQGIVQKGYSGLFYNMPSLLSDIRATFDAATPLTENELLEDVNRPDLLVLDDLGAESAREWVNDRLYLILNRRYESDRPVLVTTNLDFGELEQKLGARIISRLCEMCEEFPPFPDEDYRRRHMR